MTVNFQENENNILKTKNEINKLKNLMRDVAAQDAIMNSAMTEMNRIYDTYFKCPITEANKPFMHMQKKIMSELDEARLKLSKLEGY